MYTNTIFLKTFILYGNINELLLDNKKGKVNDKH